MRSALEVGGVSGVVAVLQWPAAEVEAKLQLLLEGVQQGAWDVCLIKLSSHRVLTARMGAAASTAECIGAFGEALHILASFVGRPYFALGEFLEFISEYIACLTIEGVAMSVDLLMAHQSTLRSHMAAQVTKAQFIGLINVIEARLRDTPFDYMLSRVYSLVAECISMNFLGVANRPVISNPPHCAYTASPNPLDPKSCWDNLALWETKGTPHSALAADTKTAAEEGALETCEYDAYTAFNSLCATTQNLPVKLSSQSTTSLDLVIGGMHSDLTCILDVQHQRYTAMKGLGSTVSGMSVGTDTGDDIINSYRISSASCGSAGPSSGMQARTNSALETSFKNRKSERSVEDGTDLRTQRLSATSIKRRRLETSSSTCASAAATPCVDHGGAADVHMTPTAAAAAGGHGSVKSEDHPTTAQVSISDRHVQRTAAASRPSDHPPSVAHGGASAVACERLSTFSGPLHMPWTAVPCHVGPHTFAVDAVAGFYDRLATDNFQFYLLIKLMIALQGVELPLKKGELPVALSLPQLAKSAYQSLRSTLDAAIAAYPKPAGVASAGGSLAVSSPKTKGATEPTLSAQPVTAAKLTARASQFPFDIRVPLKQSHRSVRLLDDVLQPQTKSDASTEEIESGVLPATFSELLSKEVMAVRWKVTPTALSPLPPTVNDDVFTGANSSEIKSADSLESDPVPNSVITSQKRSTRFESFLGFLGEWSKSERAIRKRDHGDIAASSFVDPAPPTFSKDVEEWGCDENLRVVHKQTNLEEKLAVLLKDYVVKIDQDEDPANAVDEKATSNEFFMFRLNRMVSSQQPLSYSRHCFQAVPAALALKHPI